MVGLWDLINRQIYFGDAPFVIVLFACLVIFRCFHKNFHLFYFSTPNKNVLEVENQMHFLKRAFLPNSVATLPSNGKRKMGDLGHKLGSNLSLGSSLKQRL